METSDQYPSSHNSLPSPDTAHIASLHSARLQIRSTTTLDIVSSHTIPQDSGAKFICLRWSPKTGPQHTCHRVLVANDENVRVWDLRDSKWKAVINNGSGGMGKLVNADFGRSEDEVLIFSEFGAKVTVWSLSNGRSVEIRDPKYSTAKGYGYRPKSEEFALLSRPNSQDTITIHAPESYFVLRTINLTTVDAQGLKWSPDGIWIAVWDTPSVGYRVYIYTADGHMYRMYSGDQETDIEGLGVRNMEWSPKGDYLAVSGFDKRVTLLSTRTFSPIVSLDHTPTIHLPNGEVWQEEVAATGERSYISVPQPVSPPIATPVPTEPLSKIGISITNFNSDGTLIATRDDVNPTTVWIWDLLNLTPLTVLIQHAPIKQLSWHPSDPSTLMIQCLHEEPVLSIWQYGGGVPLSLPIKFKKSQGKLDTRWLSTAREKKPALLFGDAHGHVLVWPDGRDSILRFSHPDTPERAEESEDSLFDILTGRTPLPAPTTANGFDYTEGFDDTGPLEDTFRHRKEQQEEEMDESFF